MSTVWRILGRAAVILGAALVVCTVIFAVSRTSRARQSSGPPGSVGAPPSSEVNGPAAASLPPGGPGARGQGGPPRPPEGGGRNSPSLARGLPELARYTATIAVLIAAVSLARRVTRTRRLRRRPGISTAGSRQAVPVGGHESAAQSVGAGHRPVTRGPYHDDE